MENIIKDLVWKLDREIWAHVPDGGQTEPWTTSKAREESAKLLAKAFEEIRWKAIEDYLNRYPPKKSPVFRNILLKQAREWFEKEKTKTNTG